VEATWEYDVYFENIGTTDGYFLDDFQFSDKGGPDTFGFRLVMFANQGAIGEIKVEHNRQATGGSYVIEPPLPAGTIALGKWHHFKQNVKFTFADPGGKVEYTLTVDKAATPAFQKQYDGIARADATLVRFAAMPFVFNKEKSAGLKIYWDNQVVDIK
jgi:hypothetical protein